MEDELEKKQTFLRTNILEKGYDAEEFMNFLQSKKGDLGLDLNNWDISELKIAVQEFISTLDKDKIPLNVQNLQQEEEIQKNNEEINNTNNLNNPDNNNNNDNETNKEDNNNTNNIKEEIEQFETQNKQVEDLIECQKITPNELSATNDADIKLSFPQKMDGGLFSKSYVTYLMETTPLDFKLRKRYSDFEWLRHILSIIYVNCVIPPLCKKNYADRFSEQLIAKRTRSIEKFMKGILIHPLMKNDDIFYNFISTENEAEFEKKKKLYNKITTPTSLRNIRSLTGEIDVSVSNEKEIYFQNLKNNADFNITTLQKITKGYKALMIQMDQISDKMKEISQYWKEIYKANLQYYEKPNMVESYNILSKIMQDWSETNKRQKILMNEYIREYFRYIKNEFISLKDLAQKVDNNKSQYTKAFEKLTSMKESLFKQDITNWGISTVDMEYKNELMNNKELAFEKMLPRDTKKVDVIKKNYGFYLNSIISEFERIKDLNNKRHKMWITKFIKNLIESYTDLQINLNDRGSYYDEIKEDNEKKEENEDNKDTKENENDNKLDENNDKKNENV